MARKKSSRTNNKTCKQSSTVASSKKPRTKRRGGEASVEEDVDYGKRPGGNDASWYKGNSDLIQSVASLPFSYPTGSPLQLGMTANIAGPSTIESQVFGFGSTVPGLMVLYTAPSLGRSSDVRSVTGVNISSNALYSYIRHANSGAAHGDPADTMIYLLAMSQVYSYINFLQRIYGLATLYAQQNKYVPSTLLTANRVDYGDVIENATQLRYYINLLIAQTASFAVPNVFTFFTRQAFLYSNIYTEGTSVRDQLYMFAPDGFWVYEEGSGGGVNAAGHLNYTPFRNPTDSSGSNPNNLFTVDKLIEFGQQMIIPLLGSEDIAILAGDIIKAFGSNNLITLTNLPEDYMLTPIRDDAVLEQFKNATIFGACAKGATGTNTHPTSFKVNNNITQTVGVNTASIVSAPQIVMTFGGMSAGSGSPNSSYNSRVIELLRSVYESKRILTTYQDVASEDTILENTRLMGTATSSFTKNADDTTNYGLNITLNLEPASEFVVEARVFAPIAIQNDSSVLLFENFSQAIPAFITPRSTTSQGFGWTDDAILKLITCIAPFKYAPRVQFFSGIDRTTNLNVTYYGDSLDYDNFTLIDRTTLQRLNDAVFMNLFYVPGVGRM